MSDETETSAPANPLPRLILLAVAVAILAWLGWKAWWARTHITTDNAQVESATVPILPKAGGFIAEVAIREHQPVKTGALLVRIDDRDYRAHLAQAEADLALSQAAAGTASRTGQATAQVA